MLELDLFQLINSQENYSKSFEAKELKNLPQTNPEHKKIHLNLLGELQEKNNKKIRLLHLKIYGEINLICHRCNTALPYKIDISNTVDVFPTQKILDETPIEEEYYDTIVGSEKFDIQHLAEEEILLSLPAFPTHETCPKHEYIAKEDKPVSPFAVLAVLKKE